MVAVQPVIEAVAAAPVIATGPVESFRATVGLTPVFTVRIDWIKAHRIVQGVANTQERLCIDPILKLNAA